MNTKRVLITGGAKRIGKKIALEFHQQGWDVIIHHRNSEQEARLLCEELNTIRAKSASSWQADLNDPDATLSELSKLGLSTLDALINNASSFYPDNLGAVSQQHWDDLFNSNVRGAFFITQALIPALKQTQGCIINLIDVHAERPLKQHTVYCMAKAAAAMMTKSLAKELGPEIRVNGISPGAILWPEAELNDQTKQDILARVPLARTGEDSDIAKTAWFLASQAPYITGQIIAVDGGRSTAS